MDDIVETLLERGAQVTLEVQKGYTPLMLAVSNRRSRPADPVRTAELLLDAGVDVNERDQHGSTALHHAAKADRHAPAAEVMQILLDASADADAANDLGLTPLMIAAFVDPDGSRVKVLLEAGADATARDNSGNTPLHWYLRYGTRLPNVSAIRALSERGASFNVANEYGWTPLMEAARNASADAVDHLVHHNAEVNARTKDGWTPIMIAIGSSERDVWFEWIRSGQWSNTLGPKQRNDRDVGMYAGMFVEHLDHRGQVARVWELLAAGAKTDVKAEDGTTIESLLEGRNDVAAVAIRELIKIDVAELMRRHKAAQRERMERLREAAMRQQHQRAAEGPNAEEPETTAPGATGGLPTSASQRR